MNTFLRPSNKEQLREIMKEEIIKNGISCDLNHIDTSLITDMSDLFCGDFANPCIAEFNGDISQWNVSNVVNMMGMFYKSSFNGDISRWDVSSVVNMGGMFSWSSFNNDISKWNTCSVKGMGFIFANCDFNGDISAWDTSSVVDMSYMFYESSFNKDISKWNVQKVEFMNNMFQHSKFNQQIDSWNPTSLKHIDSMFSHSIAVKPDWYIEDKEKRDTFLNLKNNICQEKKTVSQSLSVVGVQNKISNQESIFKL